MPTEEWGQSQVPEWILGSESSARVILPLITRTGHMVRSTLALDSDPNIHGPNIHSGT